MKKSKVFNKLFVVSAFTCLSMSQALAAFITPTGKCSLDSVTITSIEVSPLDGQGKLVGFPKTNATSCFGMADGNNDSVQVGDNIGALNDGLLNGEIIKQSGLGMNPNFFLTSGDKLLDLNGDGIVTDPGWIELGRSAGAGKTVNYNTITNGTKTLAIGSVLELGLTLTCPPPLTQANNDAKKISGPKDTALTSPECSSGTWFLSTKTNIITEVQKVLGRNSFDHLAFVFKAGTEWAVYDFNFNLLPAGSFDFVTPYSFTGTWNTDDFGGGKELSHFSIWARDPAPADNKVPEPATLALLAVGLLALRLGKKA